MRLTIFLIAAALTISGCSTWGYKTRIGEHTYPPVDYHKVKLITEKPDRPYEVIGIVSVQGGTIATAGDMYQKLIKSAAELGADAVILTGEGANQAVMPGTATTNVTASTYGNTTAATANTTYTPGAVVAMPTNKGLAIKFTDQ